MVWIGRLNFQIWDAKYGRFCASRNTIAPPLSLSLYIYIYIVVSLYLEISKTFLWFVILHCCVIWNLMDRLLNCLSIYLFCMKVLAIEELFKHRVSNVVFMGMGEPMLNLKSLLEAHRCLNKVRFSLSLWFWCADVISNKHIQLDISFYFAYWRIWSNLVCLIDFTLTPATPSSCSFHIKLRLRYFTKKKEQILGC
jgi:hypothetical protein